MEAQPMLSAASACDDAIEDVACGTASNHKRGLPLEDSTTTAKAIRALSASEPSGAELELGERSVA